MKTPAQFAIPGEKLHAYDGLYTGGGSEWLVNEIVCEIQMYGEPAKMILCSRIGKSGKPHKRQSTFYVSARGSVRLPDKAFI